METFFWIVSLIIFPHSNLGLLSDYKICGDPECETRISRVEAIKDHQGQDCRFLNFRRGDTIFVHHKLTGRREDLWAGSIDKQFGYFPKDAVQEEEVFATTMKVLETQKFDFFCIDESGYPVDTSHLDTDEENDHEPEFIQMSPYSHDTNAQGSLTSTDSTVKEREDEDGNKDLNAGAERLEDGLKTSATPEEQGGSPSSSWLPSSVTGWLGSAKEEQSDDSEQGVREDEREENKPEASLTSSVTGWLGFGGEGNPKNDEDSVKTEDSLTSMMTGWLGFSEEKETIAVENEENEEASNEKDSTVTFRSRRMSLDLEGSKLQEEEKEDIGTLGWLGSGLSKRLGFGSSPQDLGGEGDGVRERPSESSSWMEMKIGGIWGFDDSNTGADESTGSDVEEKEKDQMLEQPSGTENVDFSQSQASFSEEMKAETEESQMKELVDVPSALPVSDESGGDEEDNIDHSDTKKVNVLDWDSGIEVFSKDDLINNSSQVDVEVGEHTIRDQQISQTDEFNEQLEIPLDPDPSLNELDSNSMELLDGIDGEGENHHIQIKASESLMKEGTEILNQVDMLEQSILTSKNHPGDDHKGEEFNKATGLSQQETAGVWTEKSPVETQVSGDQEERNEQSQLVFSSLEAEINQEESGLPQETQPVKVNSQDDGAILSENTESLFGNVSEDHEGKISLNETSQNMNKTSESLEGENEVKDSDVKNLSELTEKEASNFEEALSESKQKPVVGSEKQSETTEELKEERKVKIKQEEEVNEVTDRIEEVKKEGQQTKLQDTNEKEEDIEEQMVNVFEEERELREESQKEVEELVEGEKWETVLLEHEQPEAERLRQSLDPNEKEQEKKEIEEVSGKSSSEEGIEVREGQKDAMKGNEEDKQVEELQDQGNEIRVEGLKESEQQNEKEENAGVSVDMKLEKETQKEVEELKEEETKQAELLENKQTTLERLEKSDEPNKMKEEVKEKKADVFIQSNTEEQKYIGEKVQDKDGEPREEEKRVKELVELAGNQPSVEELKEYMEQNKKETKEDENQVQEGQLEHKRTDIWGPELEDFELNNSSLASWLSETKTQTEIQNIEEEKKVDKQNKEDFEKEKEPPMKEMEADNVAVGGLENGEWTGKINDDGNWREDRQDDSFEEEIRKTYVTKTGNEIHGDRKEEMFHSAETQVQMSEQTESTHPPGGIESESRGAFGLFKNAFGFLSQTATPVMTESPQSVQNVNTNSAEISEPHSSVNPEPNSPEDSFYTEVRQTAFSTEQPQPHPISAENLHHNSPSVTEEPSKAKTLTKHYNNLLHHLNTDQTVILEDLIGRHKLQFLDYVLTSSEAATADDDQSILLDIERLLQHHMETLLAPSMKVSDAPVEDKQRTSAILALQKLETLLKTVKETVSTGISDVSNHQAEYSSSQTKEKEDNSQPLYKDDDDGKLKDWNNVEGESRDERSKENIASFYLTQPGSQQKGLTEEAVDFIHRVAEDSISCAHAVMEILVWIIVQAVSLLPDDMKPGPDLYGVPWEPVIFTGLVGLVTFLLFTCRCHRSIKSRLYQRQEEKMAEQFAQLLDEKCKVLETLSQCQEEYDELENLLRDSGVLAQAQKSEHLEVQAKQLEQTKKHLGTDLEHLKEQLAQQQEHRKEQERRIALLEESMQECEEETKELHSKEEQAQTTLKIYSMSSDRLQRNLETAEEENTVLQGSNTQLKQEVEGWAERVSELEAEMRRCEVANGAMMQDVAIKDERITSLTDRLLRMKCWDSELEDEDGGEKEATNETPEKDEDMHLQKVQKLIFAAKLNADLKSVDEDKDRVFAKLNDEIKAKEDLQVSIEEMEKEKLSLQSDTENYTGQLERIQQKLQIMTEMYQENELKLHRMLTVEEKERHQKEEKLSKADKNIAMAMEELNNYRKRAEEMEEELEKTKQSYQTQISSHEKKAHNNWLAARSAERELGDIRRENALFRQKITDTQFKLESLDKDPYALSHLARPLPFRAERSPYAPSPLGRPSSETRPFLSPPTLMDGLPSRLSPRVLRGPGEPPSGQAEMERSGGPHSDSGSISPTWERDRRGPPPGPPGPLGPPGYMFSDPGGPMFRRPPPPGVLGPLPPPGPVPPGPMPPRGLPLGPPHPLDMADGSFRENRFGPGEQNHRESGPGGQRTPPELDPRMGGPLPPGPPGIPIDGPYPRRPPYGPPPDFYPPRIPGGPPMRLMWPQGMMPPHRFSSGGPLPPIPNPNIPYGHPMGPLPPDGIPPPHQQSLPSPPQRQSPENRPSPEEAI